MCNMLLDHHVTQKICILIFNHTVIKICHIINVNNIIFTWEREQGNRYYSATVVKVCSEFWVKVNWYWGGFSPGSISTVHVNWIQRDSARKRADPNYSEDNIVINMESVGAPGVSNRIVKANSI